MRLLKLPDYLSFRNQYAEQGYDHKRPISLAVSSALGAYREVPHGGRHGNYHQERKS